MLVYDSRAISFLYSNMKRLKNSLMLWNSKIASFLTVVFSIGEPVRLYTICIRSLAEMPLEKVWNQIRWPMPPAFDGTKSFGCADLTAKHYDFRSSRPLDVTVIKILIKMTRPQSSVLFILMFCDLAIFFKNFILSTTQHQETLRIQNNNALQWGHHDQTIKSRRPWPLIKPGAHRPVTGAHLVS